MHRAATVRSSKGQNNGLFGVSANLLFLPRGDGFLREAEACLITRYNQYISHKSIG